MEQGNWILEADGDAIGENYYLQYEDTGPCLLEIQVFTFNYINSTTLQFIIPSGACINYTATIINSSQLKFPVCNADTESFDGDYMLFEKQ